MIIPMQRDHLNRVTGMVLELWPDCDYQTEKENLQRILESEREKVLVWLGKDGIPHGFIYVALRDYAEGTTTSPVGYIEGIYVKPEYRRAQAGRSLVAAGEQWCREKGCLEMASDAHLENLISQQFHREVGYTEVEKIVCFRKSLSD